MLREAFYLIKKLIGIISFIIIIVVFVFFLGRENKDNIYIEKPFENSLEILPKGITGFSVEDIVWQKNEIIFQYKSSNYESKYKGINVYNYRDQTHSELYSCNVNIDPNVQYINVLNDGKFCILCNSDIIEIDLNRKASEKIDLNHILKGTQLSFDKENSILGISSNARYIVINALDSESKSKNTIVIDTVKKSIDSAIKNAELLPVIEDKLNTLFMIIKSGTSYSLLKYNYNTGEYINIPNVYHYYISNDNKYLITIEGGTYTVREIEDPQKVLKRFGYNKELFGEEAIFISDNYFIDAYSGGIRAYKLGTHEPIDIAKINGNKYFSVSPDNSSIIIYNFDQDDPLSGTLRNINISNLLN